MIPAEDTHSIILYPDSYRSNPFICITTCSNELYKIAVLFKQKKNAGK